MRMLCKISMDVEAGNKAIQGGHLQKLIASTIEDFKPEATYFVADNGKRTAYFFLDMKDTSQIPVLAERWFMGVNASIELTPAMNPEDVGRGVQEAMKRL